MAYKWCVVPQCVNTSIKTPEKVFVSVPTNPKQRILWLRLSRRDPSSISMQTNVFMCEDHFNLETDISNYMKYKMGFSQKLLLAEGAVPTKFDCQEDRKRWSSSGPSGDMFLKRHKKHLITDGLQSSSAEACPERLEEDNDMKPKVIEWNTQRTNKKLQTCPSCYAVLPDAFLSTEFRDNQVRSIIAKVYHYLEQEYEELKCLYPHVELSPLGCVSRRAALATGVTELTVLEVLKEEADRLAAADQPPVIGTRIEGLSDAADCNSEVQEIKQELLEPEVYVAALPTSEPNPLMDFDEANIVVKKEQEDITCYPYSKTAADNVSSDDVVRRDKRKAAAELAGQSSTHPLKECDEATIIVKKEEEDITLNGDRLILTEVKQEDTDDEGIS